MIIREDGNSICFSNDYISLIIGKDGKAKSLKSASFDDELLYDCETPVFTVTQGRYFDNELKLMHTSREITVSCNGIRLENNCLVASFSPIPYEAVIEVEDKGSYFVFTLKDFIISEKVYGGLLLAKPPATAFRFLQLHLKERK